VQEELEEARTLAGANREATVAMARQIEVLIEDQSLKRNDLESLRRQLDASIDSAHDAQSRLRSATERQDSLPSPALLTGTPLTRPTKDPVDLGDLETGTASTRRVLDDHQDLGIPEATRTTKRIDLDDRQDPDAPGMKTTSTRADLVVRGNATTSKGTDLNDR
jgi:hypothetical protein